MAIRALLESDVEHVRALEDRADTMFLQTKYAFVSDLATRPAENLRTYIQGERTIAWLDDDDVVHAFLLWDDFDGARHIEQLSTDPLAAGNGYGKQLVRHLIGTTSTAITLCTFRDVAWNRPYYERLGFTVIPERELTPGLRRLRDNEVRLGFDPQTRCCMRRQPQR